MNRLNRRVGISGRHAVPSLLATVGGRPTKKPVKEVAVDAPPLSDSDEEDDASPAAGHSDSSDQEGPRRADIKRTSFGKKGGRKASQTILERKRSLASNNDTGRLTRNTEHPARKGKKSYGGDGAQDYGDDIQDSESDNARSKKRAKITKNSDKAATHLNEDIFPEPKKRTAKKTYTSKRLEVPSRFDEPDSPPSPKKILKLKGEPSPEVSPERKKLVLPRRGAKDVSASPPMTASLKYSKEDLDSDSDTGRKRRPPKRRGLKTKHESVLEEEQSQRPIFKLPGSFSYDDARDGINAADIVDNNVASGLSTPLSSPPGTGEPFSIPSVCPMCNDPVDPEYLKSYSKDSRMTINQQTKFCRMHKKRSAQEAWTSRGYPIIEWESLESRIADDDEYLRSLIEGKASHFGGLLSEKIKSGKSRTLFRTEESLTPGYYGLRGLRTMTELIVGRYSSLLRKRALKDRLISARGHTAYVQSVLVPELTVRLIEHDMEVNSDEARTILESSRSIGELLNDDKGDQVFRTHDSTDEEVEEGETGAVNEIDDDSED